MTEFADHKLLCGCLVLFIILFIDLPHFKITHLPHWGKAVLAWRAMINQALAINQPMA